MLSVVKIGNWDWELEVSKGGSSLTLLNPNREQPHAPQYLGASASCETSDVAEALRWVAECNSAEFLEFFGL